MEFVGIIVAVSNVEEKQGSTQPNNQASIQCYRDIVVQTQEGFPKGICATLKGDIARDFNLPEGTKVRVFFEPRAYRSKTSGKWFTSCHAWRIDERRKTEAA